MEYPGIVRRLKKGQTIKDIAIYLTTTDGAMQYGNVFDIERNKISSLTYKIPNKSPRGFKFTGSSSYDLVPGGSVLIPYDTDCTSWSFSFDKSGLSYSDNKTSKKVTVSCPSGTSAGEYILTGTGDDGNNHYPSDQVKIVVKEPEYELVINPEGGEYKIGQIVQCMALLYPLSNGERTGTPTIVTNSSLWTMTTSSSASDYGITETGRAHANEPGTYTVTAQYDAGDGNTYEASVDFVYKDVSYDIVFDKESYSAEVGSLIQINAYCVTYTNGEVTSKVLVNNSATWSVIDDKTYVSVNKGSVASTVSCEKISKSSFSIKLEYTPTGSSKIVKTIPVVFTPHNVSISYHWEGYSAVTEYIGSTPLHKMYYLQVVTSSSLPCTVTFYHNGMPSTSGYDGMVVYQGAYESSVYTFQDTVYAITRADPNEYYSSGNDTLYHFTLNTSNSITDN